MRLKINTPYLLTFGIARLAFTGPIKPRARNREGVINSGDNKYMLGGSSLVLGDCTHR